MPRTFTPCLSCLLCLSVDSLEAAETWQDLAWLVTADNPYIYCENTLSEQTRDVIEGELRLLENKGFLTTYEHDNDGWMIKILGFKPDSHLICVNNHFK